ncbi:MlaA family lipoprotein [Candidatus Enterovibrio escicola]|uniref:Lipoprotein n=3 Tax=Candidatus Enterovibrio escicola TaxID=1927127 RepID=A0A2A5T1I5_9GAMM|nr:MlaA family lipoprotein [Candidatus Enterovibrio escacola]PCS22027.1 Lipoprotein [Candidatus Enterovibrio escacola]
MRKHILLGMGIFVGLSGCVHSPNALTNMEITSHPDDLFEGFNRVMWVVNYDYLDPYISRPISLAYVDYIPSFTRTGISNFISNLEEPVSIVNSLIMLQGKDAVTHFNRFWINTVFGIAGLIDIASAANIQKLSDRKFGDTMGYYNIGQGSYLVMPLYGSLTIREGVGYMVDKLYPPLSLLTLPPLILKWILKGIETRVALVKQEEILENSLDPYAVSRDAYLQYRTFQARGGNVIINEFTENEKYFEDWMDEIDGY